ncbi:hypothetical protein EGR_02852 [Echinococcus granulosus]|uniref:Uncharacterized protein n=1 Tax=Echinococcus granulosus TaxID=6210 RepID=W6V7G0_ECHGR|nr:hypothetical protein EGR_02852 [Echinococcus granulosus]EUB62399.1 hypothetical protein EGR_02852 [Echinococcus granulosus]
MSQECPSDFIRVVHLHNAEKLPPVQSVVMTSEHPKHLRDCNDLGTEVDLASHLVHFGESLQQQLALHPFQEKGPKSSAHDGLSIFCIAESIIDDESVKEANA